MPRKFTVKVILEDEDGSYAECSRMYVEGNGDAGLPWCAGIAIASALDGISNCWTGGMEDLVHGMLACLSEDGHYEEEDRRVTS